MLVARGGGVGYLIVFLYLIAKLACQRAPINCLSRDT